MISHRVQLMLIGALIVGLTAGLVLVVLEPRSRGQGESTVGQSINLSPGTTRSQGQEKSTTPPNIIIEQESSYMSLTREEMIDQAAVIFVGKVVNISPTRWNQDSGEPWYDEATGSGLQLHYIELEVLQPIVDTIGLDKRVTITALGASPVDGQADKEGDEVITQSGPDHDLKVGNEAVIFAIQTDLAWRDGTRPILELMGVPRDAHFIRGDDGQYHGRPNEKPVSLEELINRVAQRRETLVQP